MDGTNTFGNLAKSAFPDPSFPKRTPTRNGEPRRARPGFWLRWLLVWGLCWWNGRAASAELLYFRRGGQIQAPATILDDAVRIETPFGSFAFLRSDFRTIVTGYCPEREWPARRKAALASAADVRIREAWWALENGLTWEAVAMIRSAHEAEPHQQPAARLVQLLDRLKPPLTDPDVEPLRHALNVPCETMRGPHVLLLHQQAEPDAKERMDLLERVFVTFYLAMSTEGMDLQVPSRRLVSVHLRDQSDYLAFLQSQHAGAFRTTRGYYHPTFQAVLTFDGRDQVEDEPSLAIRHHDPVGEREASRRVLLRESEHRAMDFGAAAHEMVHLLVAASGLSTRVGEFPLWLHEGLAAQFEVVRGGRWAGLGRAHDLRLPDLRRLTIGPDISPIIRDGGFGNGYRQNIYATSWALVYYLRKHDPNAFQTFLDLLRTPEPFSELTNGDRYESCFRAAFGPDLPIISADWQKFLSTVQCPLSAYSGSQ